MRSPILEHDPDRPAQLLQAGDWQLAAHFGDIALECAAALEEAVIRDASHLSRIDFSGADHLDFLHRMTTNSFNDLLVGQGLLAVFPDSRGRIVEVGMFHRISAETTRFVGAPEAALKLPAWLDRYVFAEEIEWVDRGADSLMLEMLGPKSLAVCSEVIGVAAEAIPPSGCVLTDQGLGVVRSDLGPILRLHIFGQIDDSIRLWDNLIEFGIQPAGELAVESLRVLSGIPGSCELNEDHNPWEAGVPHAVHLDKGCYIGQEVIARLDTYDKVKQRLVGLELAAAELPTEGAGICADGRPVGNITSAVYSPTLARNIALAYVRKAFTEPGTRLLLDGEGDATSTEATVVDLPFDTSA